MSDRRHTYLSSLFEASTMERWAERYLWTRLIFAIVFLTTTWTWPANFSRDDWGVFDAKLAFIEVVWGTLFWRSYVSIRKHWEFKEAFHHMTEEAMKKGPAQINIDTDGPAPRKPEMPFGFQRANPEDQELPEPEADLYRAAANDYNHTLIQRIYKQFTK